MQNPISRYFSNRPLNELIAPDRVIVDLYGYAAFVPNTDKIRTIIKNRFGYVNEDMVIAAVDAVQDRLDRLNY